MASYLTSDTLAYYNDTEKDNFVIQAGTWWDESVLSFTEEGPQSFEVEAASDIVVTLKNSGFTMIGVTEYEVYYSESDDPKQTGKIVASGEISPIQQNDTYNLTYHAEKEGTYIFKVYQRPGFQDNYEERKEIWSEVINMKFIEAQTEEEETEENSEPAEPATEEVTVPEETSEEEQEGKAPEETKGSEQKEEAPAEETGDDTPTEEIPAVPDEEEKIEPEPPTDPIEEDPKSEEVTSSVEDEKRPETEDQKKDDE
jgi:YqxM protein